MSNPLILKCSICDSNANNRVGPQQLLEEFQTKLVHIFTLCLWQCPRRFPSILLCFPLPCVSCSISLWVFAMWAWSPFITLRALGSSHLAHLPPISSSPSPVYQPCLFSHLLPDHCFNRKGSYAPSQLSAIYFWHFTRTG